MQSAGWSVDGGDMARVESEVLLVIEECGGK